MGQPTIASVRATVSAAARTEFDAIWSFRLESGRWPTNRWIYKRVTKPRFDALLDRLNGSFIMEMDSSGSKTYELQPIGVLCTSQGDRYLELTRRYIAYVRHVFFNLDTQNNISRAELIDHAHFTAEEATELGRLLSASNVFYSAPGHAQDFSTWETHLPSDIGDLLPNHGPTDRAFEALLMRHWHPQIPIAYFERAQRLQLSGSWEEMLTETKKTAPKKADKRSRAAVSSATQTKVLTLSRRRCAYCYGLNGILDEKDGQIAHIDRNSKNAKADNLAWLCLEHHNAYDSSMSQSKGYTPGELRFYRVELWRALKRNEHRTKPTEIALQSTQPTQVTLSPYAALVAKSPRDAVAVAWADVERAAICALETKMNFADRTNPMPVGAMVALLRNFAGVDQANAALLGQLSAMRNAVVHGGPIDKSMANAFCTQSLSLVAYLRTK